MAHLLTDQTWQVYAQPERVEELALEEGFFYNDGLSEKSINFWEYLGHWQGQPLWRQVETGEVLLQPASLEQTLAEDIYGQAESFPA